MTRIIFPERSGMSEAGLNLTLADMAVGDVDIFLVVELLLKVLNSGEVCLSVYLCFVR